MYEIVFITSSRIKRNHAEYCSRDYLVKITKQRNYGIGYEEPRIYNREQLLSESYKDALERWKKNVKNPNIPFFIEDTSVRIDCLSSGENEVPGLDIKYWMEGKSFEDVDSILKTRGNNRKCTVRSDIILHLPAELAEKENIEYKHFTAETIGRISTKEYQIDTNMLYPWLDNKTFNKWFVPESEDIPISLLPIEKASKYDFRNKTIQDMLSYLYTNGLIYKEKEQQEVVALKQIMSPIYILSGPTCAGKTTLAQYISDNYSYFHLEASDFMRLKYFQIHDVNSNISLGNFAEFALKQYPEIVSEQIFEFIKNNPVMPIVISGFRSYQEVIKLKEMIDKYYIRRIELIYIDAEQKLRFIRERNRRRDCSSQNIREFIEKDSQQFSMGLAELKNSAKVIIVNESSLDYFYTAFVNKYSDFLEGALNSQILFGKTIVKRSNLKQSEIKLEDAIILALYFNDEKYYTTSEISKLINNEILADTSKSVKSKNNVSRYFNFNFHPYFYVKYDSGRKANKFKISATGISKAKHTLQKLYLTYIKS